MLRSEILDRWWPTTQSLDLVEGEIERVASAIHEEVQRFVGDERIETRWEEFADLDAAFGAAADFANVPTVYLVLPTDSNWTVLWNNSFLCNGYDSLCLGLTKKYGLTTVHWSAHDEWTSFQSGAAFCYRRRTGASVIERGVQVAQEDRRWHFFESGDPLVEEDVEGYRVKRTRDRLNEARVAELLAALGARPWHEDYYALESTPAFVLERSNAPATILRRQRADVLRRANSQ